MQTILIVIQMLLALGIIGLVLMQRSDQDGFGSGNASSGLGALSGRGKATFLTRTTAILAALFMLNSLALSVIVSRSSNVSIADQIEASTGADSSTETPKADDAPLVPQAGGREDMPVAPSTVTPETVTPETVSPATDMDATEPAQVAPAQAEPKKIAPEKTTPLTPPQAGE